MGKYQSNYIAVNLIVNPDGKVEYNGNFCPKFPSSGCICDDNTLENLVPGFLGNLPSSIPDGIRISIISTLRNNLTLDGYTTLNPDKLRDLKDRLSKARKDLIIE